MTHSPSRERLAQALAHQQPDRVPVDFGATAVSGMHVSAVTRLRRHVLGNRDYRVKVVEPYQMLGEIDDELRSALGIDVVGIPTRKSLFGTQAKDWKPFSCPDGTECLVPGDFNVTPSPDGGWHIYPEGDTSVPPSGLMPKGGYFFDAIIRQEPLDEDNLDPADNTEEFQLLNSEDIAYAHEQKNLLEKRGSPAALLGLPGTAFGDIALVPAMFLKHPKGIRDIEEWYASTVERRDYIWEVFERQCEVALKNIETLIGIFGDSVQCAFISGTDFGTQRGLFISAESYRDLYKPFHKQINDFIHRHSSWKTFIHSCGGIYDLIPDIIDAGFDVLNPVQCSADGMEPRRLKREFGQDIVFWGGGVDTQHVLPFGTPDEVYRQVRERIEIFNQDGGFVFDAIHNVQGPTSVENLMAMFRAIRESGT